MHITRDAGTYVYKIRRSRCARVYEPMKFLDFHNLRGQLKGPQHAQKPAFYIFYIFYTNQPTTARQLLVVKMQIKIKFRKFGGARAPAARAP